MNPWSGWLHKARALATVSRKRSSRVPLAEYAGRVRELAAEAAEASTLSRRIWSLWQVEGLTFACADRATDRLRLSDTDLPLEAGPPAACGLSMATVLEVGFDAERLTEMLEQRADARFVDFAFESLGLMLAAYEPDVFGRVSSALGRLGLMHRSRLEPPRPAEFLAALPGDFQRYAAHGFGRLLYFKCHSLRSIIDSLNQRPHVLFTSALKGSLAAYVLVNGGALSRILTLADTTLPRELDGGIRGGLFNVVKLLDWSLPGCLDDVAAPGPRAAALLAAALSEARDRRQRAESPGLEP